MTPEATQTKSIARSAGTVSIAVLASRILGLVREQVFAVMFGAGYAYDAFVVAFRIPNLLRDLFAEGALSSAFVAVFTSYKTRQGAAATWRLANNVITAIFVIVGAITLVGAFFSDEIVALFTRQDYGAIPGKRELTSLMTTIMFPFLLLVSLSAVAMGILNTLGMFFLPSMASSFFNLGSIVAGIGLALILPRFGYHAIVGMACGVMVGGLLQLLVQVPALIARGLRYRPHIDFADPGLRRIMSLMVPAVIGLSATQINIFINTFFASGCTEGSLSWLQYAFRLMMFPIGIVGVSLSIATMPVVARHAAAGDAHNLRGAFVSSTILSFVLTIPATFGLMFLAEPIIRVIFEHGNFTAADTTYTAQALTMYAIGLFAYASLKITVPIFYALDKPRYPVIGSFLTIALNLVIILLTVERFEHRAIALSTSLCVAANFLFLGFMLYRQLNGFPLARLTTCLARVVPIGLLMGVGTLYANRYCLTLLGALPFGKLISLMIAIMLGVVFYGLAVRTAGIPEVNLIGERIRARLTGKRE
jgi:putative peptidoglycan lipid II flippase